MILNNAPVNEAIVSNVGQIGEFRIRNSAKAFSILSSGLYANKIRAIIRELSCNAVDSHAAAGCKDTPFDVHLPNSLEAHFSIRDYGTGLSHDQVTNIYTTYFESTKTASNEFIGALGLGSKSPFSYTDNITVTAIQNGRKGIYTAFINEAGVPSIAQMMEEDTDEPSGVEVKFAVNDRYDFDKFRQEARIVYKYFGLKPVISGSSDFMFELVDYESRDIIPGVHSHKSARGSVAIMGNIAYPISIPQADNSLGDLRQLLGCGLEMHFGIGELDFQASREGLSYIPETIASIKRKLEALNTALVSVLATEADAIPNLWDRAVFLYKKKDNALWSAAVQKYAAINKLPTYDDTGSNWSKLTRFSFSVDDLATTYNIAIRGFQRSRGSKSCSNLKSTTEYGDKDANGNYKTWQAWNFSVDADSHFVLNDLKTGAGERAKYHYREADASVYNRNVFVLEPADRSKAMKTVDFFNAIHNPPVERQILASSLMQKTRATGVAKNVTILKLERRNSGGYHREKEMVWRDAGKSDAFDKTATFFYVPLSGFTMLSSKGYTSGKELYDDVTSLPGVYSGEIYGVRKSDIEEIQKLPNWKNFEDHIAQELSKKDIGKILLSLVKGRIDSYSIFEYNNSTVLNMIDADSPYAKLVNEFTSVEKFRGAIHNVQRLFQNFAPSATISPASAEVTYQDQVNSVVSRYPLLTQLSSYRTEASDIAEYINLIDAKKGI
jgi:hypothetical protein